MAMHRIFLTNFSSKIQSCTGRPLLRPKTRPIVAASCEVFINYRRADTKHHIAGFLYDRLGQLNIRTFLDYKTMKPGDKLFDTIDSAILSCKLGIALFSPRYCDSYFCLHELTRMVESKKKVIPIFFDVKPSDLSIGKVIGSRVQLERFESALQETRLTVGLCFDSQNGNWLELVNQVGESVMNNLTEGEEGGVH